MKLTKLMLAFGTFALAAASAASYHVTISDPVWLNGTQVKPGDYKVDIQGDKAVIMQGKKDVAEAPAKVESNEAKYPATEMQIDTSSGQQKLQEIRIGGTNQKIVFGQASAAEME